MNVDELLNFLINNVPNFQTPEVILTEGIGYHYTESWDFIKDEGFKGASINEDLDQTQNIGSPIVEGGVVFAYDKLEDAKEEGFLGQIVKVKYKKGIRTLPLGEDSIGESFVRAAIGTNMEGLIDSSGAPQTLLILINDIESYELVK